MKSSLTLSKLPSDMLWTRVSASDQSSSSLSLMLFILLTRGGDEVVREGAGKYMLGFFWNLSLRIIPNDGLFVCGRCCFGDDVVVRCHISSPIPLSFLLCMADEGSR